MVWNELPLDQCHLEVPLGVPKKISMPVVHWAQTVHLSCAKINTISKLIERSFHLTHITMEYHWVCPKWFPCPWYFQRKPYTYLTLRLTLSPNGAQWASTWLTLPRSTIACAQSDFHARGTFVVNRAPILHRDLNNFQTDRNELLLDPRHLGVQLGASNIISEPMVRLAQTTYISCVEINTSINGPKQVSTWPTQRRSTIGCAQNDFWAYATFGANLAPILCRD
jgi:hypothetical protein